MVDPVYKRLFGLGDTIPSPLTPVTAGEEGNSPTNPAYVSVVAGGPSGTATEATLAAIRDRLAGQVAVAGTVSLGGIGAAATEAALQAANGKLEAIRGLLAGTLAVTPAPAQAYAVARAATLAPGLDLVVPTLALGASPALYRTLCAAFCSDQPGQYRVYADDGAARYTLAAGRLIPGIVNLVTLAAVPVHPTATLFGGYLTNGSAAATNAVASLSLVT